MKNEKLKCLKEPFNSYPKHSNEPVQRYVSLCCFTYIYTATDDILDVKKYLLNLGHTDIHCLGLTLGLNHLHLKKMREDSDTFKEDMIAACMAAERRPSD